MPFSAAEGGEKKKKKVGNPNGDPVRGRDAPMNSNNNGYQGVYINSSLPVFYALEGAVAPPF